MKKQHRFLTRVLSMTIAFLMVLSGMQIASAKIITGTAAEIVLSKTVTETTDGSLKDALGNVKQTYDVNLAVNGKRVYPGAPVDIVLAIDLSLSMTTNSQNLEITKAAAVSFINTVLEDTDTAARIAIVSYGTYARAYNFSGTSSTFARNWDQYGSTKNTHSYYTKDKAKALAVLQNTNFKPAVLNPTGSGNDYKTYESGATNTEGGFKVTKDITALRNRPDAASIVIFMTDGVPTMRCDGIVSAGTGTSTNALDFNNAVTAAKALKQAGNDIYTVGLLTSYAANSYQMSMANNLLSDNGSYTISGSGSNWTYEKTGGAYSTKYYPVYSASEAPANLSEIYTTLTGKSFALASGTVTDTIPADFKLIDENKADLIDMGHSVTANADGTTTVVFNNILATDVVSELPTIKIQYTGDGFGTAYTNTNATYAGVLYDSTPFNKTFPKPVAGLNPSTVNDTDATEVDVPVTIDVTANDLFDTNGFSVTGNTVSDYHIILTDASGNPVTYTQSENGFAASIVDGKVVFVSDNDTTREFYYIVKATVTPGSTYATGNSTTLVSRPTKVTVTVTKPEIPDTALNLKGAHYAYIFGYEPSITWVTDEDGNEKEVAVIKMAMDDAVTREQVAAMLMRIIDQTFNTRGAVYPMTDNIKFFEGTWYARGLAYMSSKGAFDGIEQVQTGPITRGEVAKLIAIGMNLSKTTEVNFTDIDENPYASYIKKVCAYGYMQGTSATTFHPDLVMTRAQFCTLFNNILGRNEMGLTAKDAEGNTFTVTDKTYGFTDMDPTHWAFENCLKATSAYDADGFVDIATRLEFIRNKLDQYNSQVKY